MVKLKLLSPFRKHEASNQGGRRRSTRIQEQQRRKQEEAERLDEAMSEAEILNQRTSPGQRRSFDDINSSNTRPGSSQAFRKIFAGNKKSRRSTSAADRNNTAGTGVIRNMFRPSSREVSFDALEVTDTSSDSFDVEMIEGDSVLDWMQTDAPRDVLPKILSFCGSRKVYALSRVSKTWNKVITANDLIWRVMCEDTHKVREVLSFGMVQIFGFQLTLRL